MTRKDANHLRTLIRFKVDNHNASLETIRGLQNGLETDSTTGFLLAVVFVVAIRCGHKVVRPQKRLRGDYRICCHGTLVILASDCAFSDLRLPGLHRPATSDRSGQVL